MQPWGTLWFIYMLAVFFVTAKLLNLRQRRWSGRCRHDLLRTPHTAGSSSTSSQPASCFLYRAIVQPRTSSARRNVSDIAGRLVAGMLIAWARSLARGREWPCFTTAPICGISYACPPPSSLSVSCSCRRCRAVRSQTPGATRSRSTGLPRFSWYRPHCHLKYASFIPDWAVALDLDGCWYRGRIDPGQGCVGNALSISSSRDRETFSILHRACGRTLQARRIEAI